MKSRSSRDNSSSCLSLTYSVPIFFRPHSLATPRIIKRTYEARVSTFNSHISISGSFPLSLFNQHVSTPICPFYLASNLNLSGNDLSSTANAARTKADTFTSRNTDSKRTAGPSYFQSLESNKIQIPTFSPTGPRFERFEAHRKSVVLFIF